MWSNKVLIAPSQQHGRMWQTLTSSYCKMFSVWHDQSWNHILPLGATNRACAAVMQPEPDPRVEVINFNYSPHCNRLGFFSLLEVCNFTSRYVLTQVFFFASFQIACRRFIHVINWPAAGVLNQLCLFRLFLWVLWKSATWNSVLLPKLRCMLKIHLVSLK